jgi:serine/threonine protein kinase
MNIFYLEHPMDPHPLCRHPSYILFSRSTGKLSAHTFSLGGYCDPLLSIVSDGLMFQVTLLSRIHHRNLVSFLGYSQQDGKNILVYEFMHNGTLKEHLRGKFLWSYHLMINLVCRINTKLSLCRE